MANFLVPDASDADFFELLAYCGLIVRASLPYGSSDQIPDGAKSPRLAEASVRSFWVQKSDTLTSGGIEPLPEKASKASLGAGSNGFLSTKPTDKFGDLAHRRRLLHGLSALLAGAGECQDIACASYLMLWLHLPSDCRVRIFRENLEAASGHFFCIVAREEGLGPAWAFDPWSIVFCPTKLMPEYLAKCKLAMTVGNQCAGQEVQDLGELVRPWLENLKYGTPYKKAGKPSPALFTFEATHSSAFANDKEGWGYLAEVNHGDFATSLAKIFIFLSQVKSAYKGTKTIALMRERYLNFDRIESLPLPAPIESFLSTVEGARGRCMDFPSAKVGELVVKPS